MSTVHKKSDAYRCKPLIPPKCAIPRLSVQQRSRCSLDARDFFRYSRWAVVIVIGQFVDEIDDVRVGAILPGALHQFFAGPGNRRRPTPSAHQWDWVGQGDVDPANGRDAATCVSSVDSMRVLRERPHAGSRFVNSASAMPVRARTAGAALAASLFRSERVVRSDFGTDAARADHKCDRSLSGIRCTRAGLDQGETRALIGRARRMTGRRDVVSVPPGPAAHRRLPGRK